MNVAGQVLALLGALLVLVSAVGALRFRTVFERMHALSIAGVSGLGALALGAALAAGRPGAVWPILLVIVFQVLTVPVAGHLMGRAAHRTVDRVTTSGIDELADHGPGTDG